MSIRSFRYGKKLRNKDSGGHYVGKDQVLVKAESTQDAVQELLREMPVL